MRLLILYLLIMNAAGAVSMLADKHRAKKNLWRIPEATLLAIAALGGSAGSLFGMYAFRHKTKHMKFTLLVPALLMAQTVLIWVLFC